ncbi:J domain-containing protein DDB_G0295729-like [Wyeomyia smithii]|uniref:J domain-containing protein DDB_G0295729-like n=1 Tax=Wyeomyia smithii TaxID=174621 RepID=UPI002467EDAE|nr:J domain-containing protein DDB_G0295729-like [Wyeomyia smithii]
MRMPKLRRFKQWNGGSILNLSQLTSLTSRSRNVGTVASAAAIGGSKKPTRRSEISTVSGSIHLPALPSNKSVSSGGYGLYALKCDRSAAKRGILLNLPRKLTSGGPPHQPATEVMVHEKFSPCKRNYGTVEPPPRRKRFRKRQLEQQQQQQQQLELQQETQWRSTGPIYFGDRLLERNRSELFRIAERGSSENLDARRSKLPPPARRLVSDGKTRSVENILTLRSCCPAAETDDSEGERQVSSLRVERRSDWREVRPRSLRYSESVESEAEDVGRLPEKVLPVKGKLKKASDFSIDNSSDEIEVRFRNTGSTESEDFSSVTVPLPTRVVTLKQESVKVKPKLPERPPPKKPVEQVVRSKEPVETFRPLAEVLQESLKSSELKRKWINDFLTESDEESAKQPAKRQQSTESLTKKFERVAKFDRQLEALETGVGFQLDSQDSSDSVNIFAKPNNDFEEFDKLFEGDRPSLLSTGSVKKTVTMDDQIIYINRKPNLRFSSSSSIESAGERSATPPPPPPPPPPLPAAPVYQPKSTVKIQDYYEKQLQRVRYVSAPSPSQCTDDDARWMPEEVASGPEELHEAINNNIVLPLYLINSTDDAVVKPTTISETYNQPPPDPIDRFPCNNNLSNNNTTTPTSYRNSSAGSATSSGGGVFIVGETFKRTAESTVTPTPLTAQRQQVRRYINYKFDDYCHITNNNNNNQNNNNNNYSITSSNGSESQPPGRRRPSPRKFNINDFHDNCYNEEGVIII